MQTLYVPKYDLTYRVNPKNPCELLWSKKPFGPMTAWQHAYTFNKPIRALDTDDQTGQGVVVLNDSTTYVGSGVRVWGKKFYTAGSRIYSLYAIGEGIMKPKMKIKIHERTRKDSKIQIDHYGTPVNVGVDDLLQGLSRINSLNGNFWCFNVLGFDFNYIKEHVPNNRGDSEKIIAGLGEDNVRKALQQVIKDPERPEYREFLNKIIGWTDAKELAKFTALKNEAVARAEDLRSQGYSVEIASNSDTSGPITLYYAKKSDSPRCVGHGVPDNEVGRYTSTMRNYLMDCDAGFIVYSQYGGYPVDIVENSKKLSNVLGALTINDFKIVDSDYVAKGANWKIIGSGKYGRQAVSYNLKLIRDLDAQEFYHNTPRNESITHSKNLKIRLHETADKRALKNTLYKALKPINGKYYSGENWQVVTDLKAIVEPLLPDNLALDLYCYNGGYHTSKDGTAKWKEYDFDIYDYETNKDVLNGKITCSAAGTVENPFHRYDVTITMY